MISKEIFFNLVDLKKGYEKAVDETKAQLDELNLAIKETVCKTEVHKFDQLVEMAEAYLLAAETRLHEADHQLLQARNATPANKLKAWRDEYRELHPPTKREYLTKETAGGQPGVGGIFYMKRA